MSEKSRVPISVSVVVCPDTEYAQGCFVRTVIANDGTMWQQNNDPLGEWEQIIDLPQD